MTRLAFSACLAAALPALTQAQTLDDFEVKVESTNKRDRETIFNISITNKSPRTTYATYAKCTIFTADNVPLDTLTVSVPHLRGGTKGYDTVTTRDPKAERITCRLVSFLFQN